MQGDEVIGNKETWRSRSGYVVGKLMLRRWWRCAGRKVFLRESGQLLYLFQETQRDANQVICT
jgi:hypothetical protein